MKIDTTSAEHYQWGQNCDGWHLLKTNSLSVIQERMPPNTSETLHFHNESQQFFFVISGQAEFELEGETFIVNTQQGFYIAPKKKHQIKNFSDSDLHFIVISEPKAHGDRVNL
jgi:mannose-6-phosphate isomerase-like protein (cupin superfamily)